jgi:hypothetical protein
MARREVRGNEDEEDEREGERNSIAIVLSKEQRA